MLILFAVALAVGLYLGRGWTLACQWRGYEMARYEHDITDIPPPGLAMMVLACLTWLPVTVAAFWSIRRKAARS